MSTLSVPPDAERPGQKSRITIALQDRTGYPRQSPSAVRFGTLARSSQVLLAVLAVLLLALGALLFANIRNQRETRDHVTHEVSSIVALHLMLEAMLDAETGERGFLLNGDPRFLEPLERSRRNYAVARAGASRLIAQSPYPGEAQSLARLDQLVEQRADAIDRNVELVRSDHRGTAIAPETSALGKRRMDAVRAEIARLESNEQAQRERAVARAERTENRLTPLFVLLCLAIGAQVVIAVFIERRHAVAATLALQAEELRRAHERAELVARELNHRVKNLFSVILSIVALTGRRREADRGTMEELRGRIHALALAHATSQGQVGSDSADLSDLVGGVLAPYGDVDGLRIALNGPPVLLPVRTVTPLGMIVHELATNAVKYGALSVPDGRLAVNWTRSGEDGAQQIVLEWIERGGPAPADSAHASASTGFGSKMLELAARQIDATLDRRWEPEGAAIKLSFVVTDAAAD